VEAQIQHKVAHPGITAAEDIGITDDGLLYIVMELMPGRSLRDVFIELGRLYVHEVLRLGAYSGPLERSFRLDLSGRSEALERDRSEATSDWGQAGWG
jgi:serine/threonine protein kinase